MITFEKIKYKNIMSVGNNAIEMQLNVHNKTLITGSNGAGKSTFLEALCFALFGKPFRRITKPQLINSINKKLMLVELWFSDKKHSYQIKRGQKPNIFEIWKDGALVELEASVGDYQDYLEKYILKMNINTFKQIVVLGTAGFTPFMLLTTAARREIIENLLDISVFSSMMELNKQQLKVVQDQLRDCESDISKLMAEIQIHTNYEKDRRLKSKERLNELTEKLSNCVDQYHQSVGIIHDLSIELDNVTSVIFDEVDKKIEDAQRILTELTASAKQLKHTNDYLKSHDHCGTCKQPITDEHRESVWAEMRPRMQQIAAEADSAKAALTELKTQREAQRDSERAIQQIRSRIREKEVARDMLRQQAESLRDQILHIKQDNEHEDKTQQIKDLAAKTRQVESTRQNYQFEKYCREVVSSILKDSGVKRMIIKKYIPSLNKFINDYLKRLEANYNFLLDDEFNETIKSRGRDDFSYGSFSQGERSRIDISMMFAFRELVSIRTGCRTNLLVLDEVFDSAADEEGVNGINKILSGIKDNVIIISHNEKHDKDSFDRHIAFKRQGNFTKEA